MSAAIKVENISKEYHLGSIDHGVLYKDLQSWWARLRGHQDPNARIDQKSRVDKYNFLALNDVSFEIKQGDIVGIIGRNGAGKSTLLKILSRVTTPTKGTVKVKGRVASLLEVGTGFHPELTGRENIYLNGAILGMSKKEITSKADEIIDFSGVETHIDTPVKRYSSGMYVRLAFAVAAHLDPEILVVDEVLAVGDMEFQKKCLGKMQDVGAEGRTVIFVSHNLEVIRKLCKTGILLKDGMIISHGLTSDVVNEYRNSIKNKSDFRDVGMSDRGNRANGAVRIINLDIIDSKGKIRYDYKKGEEVTFISDFRVLEKSNGLGVYLGIQSGETGDIVTSFKKVFFLEEIKPGSEGRVEIKIASINLRSKYYKIYFGLANGKFSQFYDVLDVNVGLPELEIISESDDPHLNEGYTDFPCEIQLIMLK